MKDRNKSAERIRLRRKELKDLQSEVSDLTEKVSFLKKKFSNEEYHLNDIANKIVIFPNEKAFNKIERIKKLLLRIDLYKIQKNNLLAQIKRIKSGLIGKYEFELNQIGYMVIYDISYGVSFKHLKSGYFASGGKNPLITAQKLINRS